MTKADATSRRIVSSRHLADGEGWELSELEFGMIIAYNAFSRWMTRCMTAAGQPDLSPLEILIVHNVNHRAVTSASPISASCSTSRTHTRSTTRCESCSRQGYWKLRNGGRKCSIAPLRMEWRFVRPTAMCGASACWRGCQGPTLPVPNCVRSRARCAHFRATTIRLAGRPLPSELAPLFSWDRPLEVFEPDSRT